MTASPSMLSAPGRMPWQLRTLGAASLMVCLSVGLALSSDEVRNGFASWTVAGAVIVVLWGYLSLRPHSGLPSEIEDQLRKFASLHSIADLKLASVHGDDPIVAGWNQVVERMSGAAALTRLESRLQESLGSCSGAQMSQVLNGIPDGIAITDADGTLHTVNNAFKAIFGQPAEIDFPHKTIDEVLNVYCGADAERIRAKTRRQSRPVVIETWKGEQLSDGVLRIVRCPTPDSHGGTNSYVWSIRDVTQHKLAEEMRNQFVFTATHELRTPLANIKAYAETLANCEDIDFEQQKEFYNIINAEATRLARFVDELLNVSRMESGAFSLARHETDMLRLIDEVVEHVQPEIRRKQIEFECRVPPKLPKLNIDKDKLTASLVNLLGNAVKYTPESGQVRLCVESDARLLHFHVEDTGIGIDAEELPKIFDKFFRSGDQRVQSVNGSGLGLAFTQEVARLHGGCLNVHSELDKGSRFTLTLPIDQGTFSETASRVEATASR